MSHRQHNFMWPVQRARFRQPTSAIFRSRLAARKSHLRLPKTPYPAQCITCDAALDRALRLSYCRSCEFLVDSLPRDSLLFCKFRFCRFSLFIIVSVDFTRPLVTHRQVESKPFFFSIPFATRPTATCWFPTISSQHLSYHLSRSFLLTNVLST